jgi:uncharacterized membrane protein
MPGQSHSSSITEADVQETLTEISKLLSIFGLAFFYFWPAIPAGLALGLGPIPVIITTSLSYSCGAALVTLFGGRVRDWIMRRLGKRAEASSGSIRRIVDRYGVAGLGLLSPMTVGAQIGAVLGLAFNLKPRNLFIALSLGGLAWSIALATAVSLGVLGVQSLR